MGLALILRKLVVEYGQRHLGHRSRERGQRDKLLWIFTILSGCGVGFGILQMVPGLSLLLPHKLQDESLMKSYEDLMMGNGYPSWREVYFRWARKYPLWQVILFSVQVFLLFMSVLQHLLEVGLFTYYSWIPVCHHCKVTLIRHLRKSDQMRDATKMEMKAAVNYVFSLPKPSLRDTAPVQVSFFMVLIILSLSGMIKPVLKTKKDQEACKVVQEQQRLAKERRKWRKPKTFVVPKKEVSEGEDTYKPEGIKQLPLYLNPNYGKLEEEENEMETEVKVKVKTKGGKTDAIIAAVVDLDKIVNWAEEEQKLLEKAISHYPKGALERWDKIAATVPGRSKEECMARIKYVAETSGSSGADGSPDSPASAVGKSGKRSKARCRISRK